MRHSQRQNGSGRFVGTLTVVAVITFVVVAWVGMLTAAAQTITPPAAAMEVTAVDTGRYPTVTATVTLPSSVSDVGITNDRVRVEENGAPRTAKVTRVAAQDLDVVLLIDTSGSMRGAPLAAAKTAASAFLARMPAPARIGVVGFGSTPAVASPLTTDRALLGSAIAGLTTTGETAIYDAVNVALDQFRSGDRVSRNVVLLSDGGDTASTATLDAVRDRLAASDVRLDVAELATAESRHDALVQLAGAGRGSVVPASDPAALAPIFDALGRGLANQYIVEFTAEGHGDTRLRVTVENAGQRAVAETSLELPAGAPAPAPAEEAASLAPAGEGVGPAGLLAGAALCFVALLVGATFLPSSTPRRPRVTIGSVAHSAGMVTTMTERAVTVADDALERHGRRGGLNTSLERAGIALRPGEFAVLAGSAAAAAFALGTLLRGLLVGLVLTAVVGLVTVLALSMLATRRRRRFQEQLGDDLQMMAGSLRSGYAVLQAVDVVAREAESPSREEFRRVTVEARLGRDLNTSLQAMADRVGGEDFQWVAQAIEINRDVGGDLAQVLDGVAATMREREKVRRQVQAVSAEGRLSAYVLVAMPLFIGGILSVMNPKYFSELTRGTGLVLAGVGGVMLVIGSFWMTRMVKAVGY
jgi:tight adherence protein B